MRIWIPLLLSALFLGGCATDPFKTVAVSDVTIEQAAKSPGIHRGKLVRWGGTILGVKNRKEYSLVEVLGKPLASYSEPDDRKTSTGRFMVRVPGFVDPVEYREPNRLTVVGTLAGTTKGKVGSYTYTYALVEVQQRKLWKGGYQVAEPDYYPPWWYGHYYEPWPYWHDHRPYHRPPHRPRPPARPPLTRPQPPAPPAIPVPVPPELR